MTRIFGRLLIACALTACSHHGGDDTTDIMLSVDPPTSELVIMNGTPAHQTFTATLVAPDGTTQDITADTTFHVDGAFGTFTANDLAIGTAGKTQVLATYADKSGTAQVIARVESIRIDPSLPPNTPDLFNGTEDASKAPTVVYPPLDTVMPRNLGDFEVHWTDAHGNNVFEISLHTEFSDVRVYVPGGNGLPAAGPMASWNAFQASEWLAAVGLESTVAYRVRGANTAAPGTVGADAPRTIELSNEAMEGGLYYWATAATDNVYGIFRHDMSKPGQPAEEFLTNRPTSTGRCVACHVLSRDGTKMAVTYDGGGGKATMVDVGTTTVIPDTNKWNFGTFTPDNSQFISVEDGNIVVRDASTQAVLTTMPSSTKATHPDLSPDGTKLVYVHPALTGSDWSFQTGQIFWRTYDPSTRNFGPEISLVADGKNNYYPSWSPDGTWIVYTQSAAGDAYNNQNASVWVVKADGSQPPVELAKANQAAGLTNSWARWAPFPQTYGAANEPMYWVTVSSKRDFGTRQINTGLANGDKVPQLWMTPFFPNRASGGADPSATQFRLPFQNLTSHNHIAQWTERVVVTQ